MIEVKDIYYSAGLLEGEGCFRLSHGSPEISINMTDFEPIYNLKQIMSPLSTIRLHRNKSLVTINNKDVWHLAICGQLAIEWMMTLYPLMCPRRQEKLYMFGKIKLISKLIVYL